MKKILLILLTIGAVALTLVDIGFPIFLYLNLPALLTTLVGFYIWIASGEGNLSSSVNLWRGADGAVLMSWISGVIGLVASVASADPSDAEGIYQYVFYPCFMGIWLNSQLPFLPIRERALIAVVQ